MRFHLELRGAPDGEGAAAARSFALALADSEHQLEKVFFVDAAARHADLRATEPDAQGQTHWQFWSDLAESSGAELLICAAAAQALGDDIGADNLCPAFTPCGLAELAAPQNAGTTLISFNP